MKLRFFIKILFISILCLSFTSVNAQRNKHKQAQQQKHKKEQRHNPHYLYAKLPRWGYLTKAAPKNALIITHKATKYHYHSGIFYKPVGKSYVIVKAPVGIRIRILPKERIKCNVKGKKYFYYYGTFYTKTDGDDEYLTVDPPKGANVDALPEGYKGVVIDGNEYYKFEGIYYKPLIGENEETFYEVVGKM